MRLSGRLLIKNEGTGNNIAFIPNVNFNITNTPLPITFAPTNPTSEPTVPTFLELTPAPNTESPTSPSLSSL